MDTRELGDALHAATDDLEPRRDFAADVLRGGRRRRTRNRVTIGATVAATAAVAAVAVTVLPNNLASPPPPADRNQQDPQVPPMLTFAGGEFIDDEAVTRAAVLGWQDGIAGDAGRAADVTPGQLVGEPHVFWAGTTPLGTTAIVAQEYGSGAPVTGVVVDNPNDDRDDELELVGVSPHLSPFLLPDNRTVLAIDFGDGTSLGASAGITVGDDGRSTREWIPFADGDGVAIAELPADTNPLNVHVRQGSDDQEGSTIVVLPPNIGEIQDRGLPWPAESLHIPEPRDLPRPAWEIFRDGLRDSGMLIAASYEAGAPQWTVAADLSDGRTMILSQHQELDGPAFVFSVLVRSDGSVETVTRVLQIDPESPAPVIDRAPDDQGFVVVAWGEEISSRTSTTGSWEPLETSAALVPNNAVEYRIGGTVHPLH